MSKKRFAAVLAAMLLFAFGFNTLDWFLNTNKKAWELTELLPNVFVVSWFLYVAALFAVFAAGLLIGAAVAQPDL